MLSTAIDAQALARFRLIQPFLEGDVPLAELARQHAMTLRTLQRWVQRYRQDGIAGLARQRRSDKGKRRQLSAQLHELIEALALETPRRSIATIHRLVGEVAGRQHQTQPSYDTVYNLVKTLDPALITLAHDSVKSYQQAYDLLYRHEAENPNAIWQADHTLLDILILSEDEQPVKPWLSVIMDDYSRVVAGYYLTLLAPSALQTALALRQAIWRKHEPDWPVCGIPHTLYIDHGSDFTSQHIEQVCADLKIQLVFSTVGKPRGRGKIERFFETVNQLFLVVS